MQNQTITHTFRKAGRLMLVLPLLAGLLAVIALGSAAAQEPAVPSFTIADVVTDTSVTIVTADFPANKDFVVTMGPNGTLGVGGAVVGTTNSGATGVFTATYAVPAALAGSRFIALRLESADGWYAYDWFENDPNGVYVSVSAEATAPAATAEATTQPATSEESAEVADPGLPVLEIGDVVPNTSVVVTVSNLRPGEQATVLLDRNGTLAENGYVIGYITAGPDGSGTATLPIPEVLSGQWFIAIRIVTENYYVYDWFKNAS